MNGVPELTCFSVRALCGQGCASNRKPIERLAGALQRRSPS